MDCFLRKNASILYRRLPELCETCFIMDTRALFDYFWTFEYKHPPTSIVRLEEPGSFNITPIGFVWKKKVIYT